MSGARGGLAALGGGLVGLTVWGLALHAPGAIGIGGNGRMRAFVAVGLLSGLAYLAACALVMRPAPGRRGFGRGALAGILAVAALARGLVLVAPPFLSTDLYRYVWDGKVQQAGINPYRYIPADPHLRFLRDRRIYPFINRKGYAHTIYPPAAELVFRAVAAMSPSVLAMKAAMTGVEMVAIAALLLLLRRSGQPPERVLIYAWNPLAIWELAGNGHVDALAVGFIALALLAAGARRSGLGGFWLAAATLTKFLPAVIFPALWGRRDWRMPGVFSFALLAFYLPFLGVGWRVFGFLGGYLHQEGLTSGEGIFYLFALDHLVPLPAWVGLAYLVSVLALLAGLAFRMVFGPRPEPGTPAAILRMGADARRLGTVLLVALTPHYPWYFTWILVPATLSPALPVLALASGAFLLYLDPVHTGLLWPALLFGGFGVLAVAEAGRISRRP